MHYSNQVFPEVLYADKQNDPHIKKSRYMSVISVLYTIFLIFAVATGITKMYFYSGPRFPIPVHIMFWGNIIAPATSFLLSVVWCVVYKKWSFNRYVKTETAIPYNEAISLENAFTQRYSEMPDNGNGVQYYIRTSTQQINS